MGSVELGHVQRTLRGAIFQRFATGADQAVFGVHDHEGGLSALSWSMSEAIGLPRFAIELKGGGS